MSKPLQKDLQELVQADIITQATAEKITDYYQAKKDAAPNKFNAVLGILGAVLVGFGIILVVAHNWDILNTITKTILAFVPLTIGQGLCIYTLIRKKGNIVWQESSATILFFSVAAAIALISQIYHISGSLTDFLLTWLLLTFALIYLMPSSLVSLLFIATSTWYAVLEGYSGIFSTHYTPIPWWYLILLVLIVPHYYRYLKYKPGSNFFHLLNWFLTISLCITLAAFSTRNYPDNWIFEGYISLFTVFYLTGNSEKFRENKLFANPFNIVGLLGIIGSLMICSNTWFWSEYRTNYDDFLQPPFSIIIFTLLIATCLLLFLNNRRRFGGQFNPVGFSPFIFIIALLLHSSTPSLSLLILNACILSIAIYYIRKGSLLNHFGILNFGLLIIAVLAILRFFDDTIPFIWRGIFFLAAGIGFFAANYLLLKKRKTITQSNN